MPNSLFAVAAVVTMLSPALGLLAQPPVAAQPLLVLLPPWQDGTAMVAAAGGRVIGPDAALFAVLAVSDSPDFIARLAAEGAWAVRDGAVLAQLCGGV